MKTVWKGPEEEGITQSLLSRFLVCRERFRLLVVEGLRPAEQFNHRLEYGSMWHICEEALAQGQPVGNALKEYCTELCKKYQTQQTQIEHWYKVCKVQFPVYVEYWKKHPDVKSREPILQEEVFCVPYTIPSGRIVKLRGKFDSVDLVSAGKTKEIYLQENKTKGDIDEQQMRRQLTFDLQTMFYRVALSGLSHPKLALALSKGYNIAGVRYNVVRRPLAGGKNSIRQTQKETIDEFYERLGGLIAKEPEFYFMRWNVTLIPSDINAFKTQFLNPILEQLCDWWHWITSPIGQKHPFEDHGIHWRTPYGFWNILAEGGSTELDEYLANGSELGLERNAKLFGELQ